MKWESGNKEKKVKEGEKKGMRRQLLRTGRRMNIEGNGKEGEKNGQWGKWERKGRKEGTISKVRSIGQR